MTPRLLVLADPDPDVAAPPLHLLHDGPLGGRVDVTVVGAAAGPAELAGAAALYLWDHRFGALGPLLRQAPQVRWVHCASVGVDRLLCDELRGVTLTNSRGVFDTSITEWVLAVVLAHVKGLRRTWELQQQAVWEHRVTGRLAGTRAAVVGTGSIGRAVAAGLAALHVDVTLVGRLVDGEPLTPQLLARIADDVDLLVLAVPLTPDTTGLVDAGVLSALGPGGLLVNVGRGRSVVEDDLVRALAAGRLGGAALDVVEVEPLPAGSPLWALPQVLVSPHMSGDYRGFELDMMALFVDNLERWLRGAPLRNVVDPAAGYVRG